MEKYTISYSKKWAFKTANLVKMKSLREICAEKGITLDTHDNVFDSKEKVKNILNICDNGFDDIVSRTKINKIQDYLYDDAIDWILKDPNSNLISILMLIERDNQIWRLERNLDGVKYYLKFIK